MGWFLMVMLILFVVVIVALRVMEQDSTHRT